MTSSSSTRGSRRGRTPTSTTARRTSPKSSGAGYNNPEYDRLCQEGRKALKAEDRAKIYAQLEQLRRTDLPYYPTNYVPQVAAWRENVKGWSHWAAGYARVWGVSK